jgi:diguanylate cyclase (GGDEF)-like protein
MCPKQIASSRSRGRQHDHELSTKLPISSRLARRRSDRDSKIQEAPQRAFELISSKAKLVSGMPAMQIMRELTQVQKQRAFFSELAKIVFLRQRRVKELIKDILATNDPDALVRAYRTYGNFLSNPSTLSTYMRGEQDEFKGNIRINYSSGGYISRQMESLSLMEDPFARFAIEENAIIYRHGNKLEWVHIEDLQSPHIERRRSPSAHEKNARLVMPLGGGFGILDVQGPEITFGLGLARHNTALLTALELSHLISQRLIDDIDPVSGFFNRQAFVKLFHHYSELFMDDPNHKQRTSLISLEIDRFENVNRIYGCEAGDEVLKMCGDVLMKMLRTADATSPYIAPKKERFNVLLIDSDEPEAVIVARRIKDILQSRRVGDRGIKISTNFGICNLTKAFEVLVGKIKNPSPSFDRQIREIRSDPFRSMSEKLMVMASVLADFAVYYSRIYRRNVISTPHIESEKISITIHR